MARRVVRDGERSLSCPERRTACGAAGAEWLAGQMSRDTPRPPHATAREYASIGQYRTEGAGSGYPGGYRVAQQNSIPPPPAARAAAGPLRPTRTAAKAVAGVMRHTRGCVGEDPGAAHGWRAMRRPFHAAHVLSRAELRHRARRQACEFRQCASRPPDSPSIRVGYGHDRIVERGAGGIPRRARGARDRLGRHHPHGARLVIDNRAPLPPRPYRPTCARALPCSKCGRRGDSAAFMHGVRLALRRPALKWDAGTGRPAATGPGRACRARPPERSARPRAAARRAQYVLSKLMLNRTGFSSPPPCTPRDSAARRFVPPGRPIGE